MRVSVITVCLNSAATIADSVRSVRDQIGVTIEHIIKDGGSRDKTVSIAHSTNPDTIIYSCLDKGIYDAMNQGFALSRGDIVAFLNSDDYYHGKDVILSVVNTFEKSDADIVYGDIVMTRSNGQVVRHWKPRALQSGSLTGRQLPHPAFFVRRSVIETLSQPFDTSYYISADLKQQLLLIEKMKLQAEYLPKTLTVMRMSGRSTRSLRAHWLGWKESARAYREVHNRSGHFYVLTKVASKLSQLRFVSLGRA